jgi:hypothetical protein
MGNSELSFARHNALTTRDWDTYQLILRRCLGPSRQVPDCSGMSRKTAVKTAIATRRPVGVVQ